MKQAADQLLTEEVTAEREWSVDGIPILTASISLPRPVRWVLALALLLAVLIFGVYGTGYDPQDFIYFKF